MSEEIKVASLQPHAIVGPTTIIACGWEKVSGRYGTNRLEEAARGAYMPFQQLSPSAATVTSFQNALEKLTELAGTSRIAIFERELRAIASRVTSLEKKAAATVVPITTLAPEPYELLQEIPIVIQPVDDEFVATFYDANISASGETDEEAFRNAKLTILAMFQRFSSEAKLGPEPSRQLKILNTFLRPA